MGDAISVEEVNPAQAVIVHQPESHSSASLSFSGRTEQFIACVSRGQVLNFKGPTFEYILTICTRFKHELNNLKAWYAYSAPPKKDKNHTLWIDTENGIGIRTNNIESVEKLARLEIARNANATASTTYFIQLLEFFREIAETTTQAARTFNTIIRAREMRDEKKYREKLRNQEIVTFQVNNAATILNSLAQFVPEVSAF
ncbi:hypothetical protein P171DRAFT_150692 [Karstenula rhodostoma CBS 690.94]|uniref:Uncharacterized protein n=1 Tax=Karstenula rhodostoma CBS 690.94 TaxID=1392251 RepID=A0A9P4PV27_9PLEO|nr:hypothetical protein P171DRAFT_150692 [Karstenula rhodostoma CBS 690.94]